MMSKHPIVIYIWST